jgi:asparagine synthase (glutamine-hydrolysing)
MCGIFGSITTGRTVEIPLALRQLNTMIHRGPDGYGLLVASMRTGRHVVAYNRVPQPGPDAFDVALGHRRLAILDLSPAAAQPMSDADGRFWITFNGEIYNWAELRRELMARGHDFRTDHSDTETLLLAFKEWGEDCLSRVRGMFAVAIVDLQAPSLFLARDRLGKKPLYYRVGPDGLVFASELKAIVADPRVQRRIDPIALAQYLMYNCVPAPRTIYEGIAKLPAAHYARVDLARPGRVQVREYWALSYQPTEGRTLEAWIEEFEAEFAEAVRLRMISDVPLGALLSGGIDSSVVVRAMARLGTAPIKTFSVGFNEAPHSELAWARTVAEKYGTDHYEEIVDPNGVKLLPMLAAQYDEPFGDDSALPTHCISEIARRHVTVVLSGDGGDELFAGYNRYDRSRALARIDVVPLALRRLVFGTVARLWPEALVGKGSLALLSQDPYHRYRDMRGKPEGLQFLTADIRRAILGNAEPHAFFARAWARAPHSPPGRWQYVDTVTYLPDDVLAKLDRAAMLNSLEARCPLLDHRVVELAARIPSSFKYRDHEKKLLLKRLLEPDLGAAFVSRKKTGFGVPMDRWFRGDLAGYVSEALLDDEATFPEGIDRRAIARFVRAYRHGNRDLGRYLWNLLMLDAWWGVYGRSEDIREQRRP